ncbi:MAG: hypothetical protein HY587_08795 [Candidatus Omnitrophica bacterium]|nr:hypothetical protein [Candidatus Omnitrophota bacterium]
MKIKVDEHLFWFLRADTILDLDNPSDLRMYVQQVLSRGRTDDVRRLLKTVSRPKFEETFRRIENFLPPLVKNFWNDFLADHQ